MTTIPNHLPKERRAVSAAAVIGGALRGLGAHHRRIVPTFLAVLLGVAFTAGTLILTDTLGTAFGAMHTDNHAGIDIAVRRPASFGTGPDAQRNRVEATLADDVATIAGVVAAAGRTSGWAQLTGPDGELLGDVSSGVDPVGENWIDDPRLNPWTLAEGAPPLGANEVVVDRQAADDLGVRIGDTLDVLALGGAHEMTITGIATFGTAGSRFGTVTALFDDTTAQKLLGEPGRHDSVIVRVADGVAPPAVAERIERSVDGAGPIEVVTGAELAEEAHAAHMQDWGFFDTFMVGFAGIALLVGGFIIFNTFSITVAQRTREFAMLRAIGAGRAQVVGSVMVESLAVGTVASLLGLAAGVGVARGLHALFAAFGIALPDSGVSIGADSLGVAFVLGVGITVLSALLPALRASRVRPLAALRDSAVDRAATSRRRVVVGAVTTTAGAATMAAGLGSSGSIALVAGGGLAVFVGTTVLGPVLVAPFARTVGRPIAWLRGMPGHLARDNAGRCPKRTAATAGALTIGVALVGLITILAASVKASIDEMVATGVRSDLVVDSNSVGFGGLDRSLATRLHQLPEVAAVSGMSVASAEIAGDVMAVTGVDSAELETLLDLGDVDGSIAGPNGSGLGVEQLAVNADLAAERGWEIGTAVPVTLADGVERTLTVGAIVEDPYIGLPTIVDADLLDDAGVTAFDLQVFVGLRDGTDSGDGVAAVSSVVAEFPQAELLDPAGFADNRAATVDPLLGVIYALLGFAVLIAALGIMNTLALSIMERTRELGVLRAIGASQAQVRTLVRWEAVLIAGFGTLLGLLIGIGFGWSIVRALESDGITNLVVPVSELGLIAGMAAVTGVLAAVVPGRRAARLDVLDALRS